MGEKSKPKTSVRRRDIKRPTVFLGMSGGVDSSVSAALLKDEGYDVVGVFIKVWSPQWLPCTWPQERRDAMRVAAALDIPLLTFDFQEVYKQEVVDYMVREYAAGRTPNPDVMCNKAVKFGAFLDKARSMGADFVATGHYARVTTSAKYQAPSAKRTTNFSNTWHSAPGTRHFLSVAVDTDKDQTYFLWTLTQNQLRHALFPIGHLHKTKVRALAKKYKLPVAEKKDSQGLCFIGHVDMKHFLSRYIRVVPGEVMNEQREVIGVHDGAVLYTIGERHGFTITKKTPHDDPYYVLSKDHERNIITVTQNKQNDLLDRVDFAASDANWIRGVAPDFSKKYSARIRHRGEVIPCTITPVAPDRYTVHFDAPPHAGAAGQSIVLYDGTECLGGVLIS